MFLNALGSGCGQHIGKKKMWCTVEQAQGGWGLDFANFYYLKTFFFFFEKTNHGLPQEVS